MTEKLYAKEIMPGVETHYDALRILHEEKTPFQEMRLIETTAFGKMLILDDVVQTTVGDEFIYHEMMTHVPLFTHPAPKSVLIIGGGDGGILRETLKHPRVNRVVMVEIDEKVITFCKKHLPEIPNGAFDDPRSEVIIDDGASFVRNTKEKFDVVIVDSPDPAGPAKVLFTRQFYTGIKAILNPEGVMVRQTGSTFIQRDEQREAFRLLSGIFPLSRMYLFCVPTYVCGFFSSIMSSLGPIPEELSEKEIAEKMQSINLRTKYYNPGVHAGAFNLPEYVKGIIT